jgi:hypothetical protein
MAVGVKWAKNLVLEGVPARSKREAHSDKIAEIKNVLIACGLIGLDDQAEALGIKRTTAWHLLSGRHKQGGMSASVISDIRRSPKLPDRVRVVIEDYVVRKLAGQYGHSKLAIARFRQRLDKR